MIDNKTYEVMLSGSNGKKNIPLRTRFYFILISSMQKYVMQIPR